MNPTEKRTEIDKREVKRLKNNPDELQASYDEWNAVYNERNE
jgi:hypothetical protein